MNVFSQYLKKSLLGIISRKKEQHFKKTLAYSSNVVLNVRKQNNLSFQGCFSFIGSNKITLPLKSYVSLSLFLSLGLIITEVWRSGFQRWHSNKYQRVGLKEIGYCPAWVKQQTKEKGLFSVHAYIFMIVGDLEIIFCNLNETGHVSTEYKYYNSFALY